jgi:hypothetical protein
MLATSRISANSEPSPSASSAAGQAFCIISVIETAIIISNFLLPIFYYLFAAENTEFTDI